MASLQEEGVSAKYWKMLRDMFGRSEASSGNKDEIEEVWKLLKETMTNEAIEMCGVSVSNRKKGCQTDMTCHV